VSRTRSPLDLAAKLLAMRVCRALGARRAADVLYVRRLEGYLSTPKVRLLYDAAAASAGRGAIAEVGSWKGKSTVALALGARRAGHRQPLYAIDHHAGVAEDTRAGTWTPQGSTWAAFLATIRRAGVEDRVHPLKMDSLSGARWLAERAVPVELLFIDGAHDEESVVRDLEAFFPLVLPGGWIALDDAKPEGPCPGVYRAYQRVIEGDVRPLRWAGSLLLTQKAAPECDGRASPAVSRP
jgi:predicted O-methyltransferase YrrM